MEGLGFKSTRVVLPSGVEAATVIVRGERIVDVFDGDASALPASVTRVIDFGDRVLSPGVVDCHVHVNEPGRTEWEGFETATRAAAAGGVTTIVDMPLNSNPVTTDRAALDAKLGACAGKCFVDVGFWGGVVPGNVGALEDLASGGVLGCKAFLVHSGIDDFPNASEVDLRRAMPVLRDLGLPLLAHAELDLGAPAAPSDPRTYGGYLASRPPEWEDAAIRLLIDLCRATWCPVHIVHLSSAGSLPALRRAKDEGLPVTVETCPHYLCLDAEAIPPGATEYKCAPPIRTRANREALWQGLFEGIIDFVVTDHSPCLPALKLPAEGDFMHAWGGIASLQLGLPAVWTEARARGATLPDLARWLSGRPAAFSGLASRKGSLAPGHDADFVVWDPDATFPVDAEGLFFRHRVSPYLGRALTGRVHETWLRGERVFAADGHAGTHQGAPRGETLLHRSEAR
ncbi:MAG TPA: allantoinase AllB [Polyangiaceae bacterium]|nr:allantoinase AllB [Polyangiaceae bacterium]